MCFIGTCLKNIKSEQSRHFFGVFDSELAKKTKKKNLEDLTLVIFGIVS